MLRATARHDGPAFAAFYERYAPHVLAWLERQLDDRELALDLTAETFAEALATAHRFRPRTGGSAAPWLFGIAANLVRRVWRARAVETRARARLGVLDRLRFGDDTPDLVARVDARTLRAALRDGLAGLPAAQRRAVELRVVAELSYEDVAAELHCSETAARIRVHRALEALRVRLGRADSEAAR